MVIGRTVTEAMVDSVWLFLHFCLFDDAVEQPELADPDIQPYGVRILPRTVISRYLSLSLNIRRNLADLPHCLASDIVFLLSGN